MSAIRKLNFDNKKCIGCQACMNACPEAYITFADHESTRAFQFAETCAEDCNRCEEACSENAISLAPAAEASEGFQKAEFPLLQCTGCGVFHATEKMVDKTRTSLAAILGEEACSWTAMCPACRQASEAFGAAQQHLLTRAGASMS